MLFKIMAIDSSQFSPSTIALLSALISSIITIGITKVLDLIQKRQEYKYSLQKIFVEKKLEMAEDMVAFFYRTKMVYQSMSRLLEKAPSLLTTKTSSDFFFAQIKEFSDRGKKLEEETKKSCLCFAATF